MEDENVRQRDPATSLFSASSIKTDNTGKMDLADARWRAMNGEKKWLDVNETEREEILSSAASGSDRSTMNTRHSETGYEGKSLSGCDDDDEGTLDLVEGALLQMLSRGGRPKHHQTSNLEFNGLEGSSGQHAGPSARTREVGSSNAVKDAELLAKLLDQVLPQFPVSIKQQCLLCDILDVEVCENQDGRVSILTQSVHHSIEAV